MKKLLVALVVLGLIAVGLDRGGVYVASRVAASSLQSSQGLSERPDVTIAGFPFLDQVATGRYDRIDVTAYDLPLGEGRVSVRLSRLDVALADVVTSRDFSRIDVGRARADAVISYDDLGDALGIDLSFSGGGQITASRTFTVLGQEVTPRITVEPAIVDGALGFGEFTVNGAADAADVVRDALDDVFDITLPLQAIPFDVDVDDVSARRDGVHVSLSGSDLRYVAP